MGYLTEGQLVGNFGGKKAAPFASAKKSAGKAKVKRKASSAKTAKGSKKRSTY